MMALLQQLSRRNQFILGLVALALLGNIYVTWLTLQEADGKLSLTTQLEDARLSLTNIIRATNLEVVQAELAAAQAQLKEAAFPESVPTVDLVALLVKAARETGVELGNLQVLAVEPEKVGASNYNVVRQRLQVRGSPSQVSAFLSRLEKGGLRTLVTNNLILSPRGAAWEARLDLYLYSTR